MPFPVMIPLYGTSRHKRQKNHFRIPHRGSTILDEFSSGSELTLSAVGVNLSTGPRRLGYRLQAHDNSLSIVL